MADEGEVQLLSFWASPFVQRAKVALAAKGVAYTEVAEDLASGKSELLLSSNPVHKKVPVLLHKGKAVCESMIIVEYVDEAFPGPPLLPTDPFQKATARFWADFCDRKVFPSLRAVQMARGDEQKAAAVEEAKEQLRVLEEGGAFVGGGPFFGGAAVGGVDIAMAVVVASLPAVELLAGVVLLDAQLLPRLGAWTEAFLGVPEFAACFPDCSALVDYCRANFHLFPELRKT